MAGTWLHKFDKSIFIMRKLVFPLRPPAFLATALLCILLAGCAAEVVRLPASLKPLESGPGNAPLRVGRDTPVIFDTGYERVIRKDSSWKAVGRIAQGKVYACANDTFSVEGAHVHEAYLVVAGGSLVGFYLPVEKSFSPLQSNHVVNLWEEK